MVLRFRSAGEISQQDMAAPTLPPLETIRILLLVDNPADVDLWVPKLKSAGLPVEADVSRLSREFTERVGSRIYDIILLDCRLPDWNGLEAFKWLRSSGYNTPVILVAQTLEDELAVECVKTGVNDYVLKENLERLPVAVRGVLDAQRMWEACDRSEKVLRESEKQYRLLFDANPQPMWVIDSETLRVLTVNHAATRHYGYSREEFLSMALTEVRAKAELQRFQGVEDPRRDFSESYVELWKHRKKDGTLIDVEVSSRPIIFGTLKAQLVLAHDVTAQWRAEEDVRASKEQLQLLFDSTAEAICATDVNGACALCNAACLRLLGYSRASEVLGKNMHALMHHTEPDGGSHSMEACPVYLATSEGKATHVTNEICRRADGTNFPSEYWSYPLRRENRIVGCVVTFVDITQRKNSEEASTRSESEYRSIIEGAPYGIYRVDQNGRVKMANPALVAMLGYQSQSELLGLSAATDIFLDPMQLQRAISLYRSEGAAARYEAKWKRKDGTSIVVRLAGGQLSREQEDPIGFEVFAEDITEQRSLRKQFEHAQKMEAVARLAGGVAHDFNNLLMIVGGYAQLMEESSADPKKVAEYATHIQHAMSKAATVTRQLLAFSRKQVLEPTVLDLTHVVKDIGEMLPRLLGEDMEIAMDLQTRLGAIRADRGHLEQIIMNLAVNARDAMPQGGRLTVATSNVSLDASYYQGVEVPMGRYVLLAISDTGTGMDIETQLHIFEPFFTTKGVGKGTGLGLATVYGLVKQNHGFIWFYSEAGKGSVFKIYLPRVDVEADSDEGLQPVPVPSGGPETILLVDDEAVLRDMCGAYLESKGYTVLKAGNAKEAMEICRSYDHPIHLLITDVVMPGLGGIELAKSALELRPALAVILVSGHTGRRLDRAAIGFAKFLQKPFGFDALDRTIRSLLDKNREILLIEDSRFMRGAIQRALTDAGYIVHTAIDGEAAVRAARQTLPDLVVLDLVLKKISGLEVLRALKQDAITKSIPVVVLAVLSETNSEDLLSEGAAACVERSDKLSEKNSAALIHTVAQVAGQTKVSSR
jgi:two-component system, cell cycle sensor histidine kinase and response regulator CckA